MFNFLYLLSLKKIILLQFDMKYYYEIGSGKWRRRFWFFTPPKPGPDVPYTFGLIGINFCL